MNDSFRIGLAKPPNLFIPLDSKSSGLPAKTQKCAALLFSSLDEHLRKRPRLSLSDDTAVQWIEDIKDDLQQINDLCTEIVHGDLTEENLKLIEQIDKNLAIFDQPLSRLADNSAIQVRMGRAHTQLEILQRHLKLLQNLPHSLAAWELELDAIKHHGFTPSLTGYTNVLNDLQALISACNELQGESLPSSLSDLQKRMQTEIKSLMEKQSVFSVKLHQAFDREIASTMKELKQAEEALQEPVSDPVELQKRYEKYEMTLRSIRWLEEEFAQASSAFDDLKQHLRQSSFPPTAEKDPSKLGGKIDPLNAHRDLMQRVDNDAKKFSKLLAETAVPKSKIEAFRALAANKLAQLDPSKKLELPRPLTPYICERDLAKTRSIIMHLKQEQAEMESGIRDITPTSLDHMADQLRLLTDLDERTRLLPPYLKITIRKEIREAFDFLSKNLADFTGKMVDSLGIAAGNALEHFEEAHEQLNNSTENIDELLKNFGEFEMASSKVDYVIDRMKTSLAALEQLTDFMDSSTFQSFRNIGERIEQERNILFLKMVSAVKEIPAKETIQKNRDLTLDRIQKLAPKARVLRSALIKSLDEYRPKGKRATFDQRQGLLIAAGVIFALSGAAAAHPYSPTLDSVKKLAAQQLKETIGYCPIDAENIFTASAKETLDVDRSIAWDDESTVEKNLDFWKERQVQYHPKKAQLNLPASKFEQIASAITTGIQMLSGFAFTKPPGQIQTVTTPETPSEDITVVPETPHPIINRQAAPLDSTQSTGLAAIDSAATNVLVNIPKASEIPDTIKVSYGDKHRRIVEMHDHHKLVQTKGVEIPLPIPLASQHVEAFIAEIAPDTFREWQEMGYQFRQFKLANKDRPPADFLNEPGIKARREALQKGIKDAYSVAGNDQTARKKHEGSAELEQWVQHIAEKGSYLMVRSTGAEDSSAKAGSGATVAGGNLSISYVKPNMAAVMEADGEVVASYFGVDSLKIRIEAGEDPFSDPLKLAVTHQELIGEPVGGATDPKDIPISIVLFSNEPHYIGNQSTNDKFRTMRISCSYGHGDGVVGRKSGVNTEQVLVMQSRSNPEELYVVYTAKEKPMRLAPQKNEKTGKVELQLVANPPEISSRKALDAEMVQRLFALGVDEEQRAGHAADMEIVIKNGIIYPVQSRDVKRKPAIPSYIDPNKITSAQSAIHAKAQALGNLGVLNISSPDEVLVAATLLEAEGLFKEGIHKMVLFTEPEPDLSHSIVNFNDKQIPCFCYTDKHAIDDLVGKIGKDKHKLLGCIQTGTLLLWDESIAPTKSLIQEGYIAHPAPVTISLDLPEQPPMITGKERLHIPRDLQDLFYAIKIAKTNELALEKLSLIAKHPTYAQTAAMNSSLKGRIKKLGDLPTEKAKLAILTAEKLEEAVKKAFRELEAVLKQHDAGRMEILLNVKILETLTLAPTIDENALSSFSVLNLARVKEAADLILDYQEKLAFPAQLDNEALYAKKALTPEAEKQWINFLIDIEVEAHNGTIPKTSLDEFKSMLKHLQDAKAMPLWLTLFFAPARKEHITSKDLLELLMKEYDPASAAFINEAQQKRGEMRSFLHQIDSFKDPKHFDEAWADLQKLINYFSKAEEGSSAWESIKNLMQYFVEPSFLTKMQHNSRLAKLIAAQTLLEMTELLDTSIKLMKSSPEFDRTAKASNFKKMVLASLTMMQGWTEIPSVREKWLESRPDFQKEIEEITQGLQTEEPSAAQLESTSGFDVSQLIFSKHVQRVHKKVRTHDDGFTVAHQNQLAVITTLQAQLVTNENLKNAAFPQLLMQTIGEMESFSAASIWQEDDLKASRTGIQVTDNTVVVHYNIPIKVHSATLQIVYDKLTQKTSLQCQIYGLSIKSDRRERNAIATLKILQSSGILFQVKAPSQKSDVLTFSWDIDNDKKAKLASAFLEEIILRTLAPPPKYIPFRIHRSSSDDSITGTIDETLFYRHAQKAGVADQLTDFFTDPSHDHHEDSDFFMFLKNSIEQFESIKNDPNSTQKAFKIAQLFAVYDHDPRFKNLITPFLLQMAKEGKELKAILKIALTQVPQDVIDMYELEYAYAKPRLDRSMFNYNRYAEVLFEISKHLGRDEVLRNVVNINEREHLISIFNRFAAQNNLI